jgi:hypothetical protein
MNGMGTPAGPGADRPERLIGALIPPATRSDLGLRQPALDHLQTHAARLQGI